MGVTKVQSGLSALQTFLDAGGVTHTQLEELKTALEALAEGGDTKEVLDDIYARLAAILAKQSSDPATSAKQDTAKGILDNIEAGIDEVKVLLGEVQAAAADIKAAVVAAVGISTGTKTCATSAGRLKAATLENVVSLTVKVRSLGDASYVGVGNASGQDFRLTAIDDSIELDIDPYAVYVIDDHTSTAAVVEYIARLSA